MKITINLSSAEVKGIKDYLLEVGDIDKPLKKDIQNEVSQIIHGYLHAPQCAIADCVKKYEIW